MIAFIGGLLIGASWAYVAFNAVTGGRLFLWWAVLVLGVFLLENHDKFS